MLYFILLHGICRGVAWYNICLPKVFGVCSQSLWGVFPKSLGCIAKVFGVYCQSLWGVLPKTFAYHCLYHKALMFVPYNFMFYTITIHQKSRVCIHSLAVYDLQVPQFRYKSAILLHPMYGTFQRQSIELRIIDNVYSIILQNLHC